MSTLDRIRAVAIEKFEVDAASIRNDVTFETLGIDSLSMVEMLFAVEDEFSIRIPAMAAEKLTCLDDLAVLVDQLVAQSAADSSLAA